MPKRNLIWILAILAAALVTLLATRNTTREYRTDGGGFDPVDHAYRLIKDNYIQPLDDEQLQAGAIREMVARLDEYSVYIPPAKADLFAARLSGNAWGLGLKVAAVDGNVVVVGALPDSPAEKLNLCAGDILLDVADLSPTAKGPFLSLAGKSAAEAQDTIDHAASPQAALRVLRADGRTETFTCSSGHFPLESVQGLYRRAGGRWQHMIDGPSGVGYMRITEFLPPTVAAVQQALESMDHPHGLAIDLRDNPGGSLDVAVGVCESFLRKGVIVSEVDRAGKVEQYRARSQGTVPDDIRLVVLINSDTASAAEIVAASLAYHDRAVLVGERTRGKGCVQKTYPLGKLGWLNLTTSEFFVDPCRPINRRPGSEAWGVDPHVPADMPAETWRQVRQLRVAAEVIPYPSPATQPASTEAVSPAGRLTEDILKLDAPLRVALALLQDPPQMKTILQGAAAARAARDAGTGPATAPAEANSQDSQSHASLPAAGPSLNDHD